MEALYRAATSATRASDSFCSATRREARHLQFLHNGQTLLRTSPVSLADLGFRPAGGVLHAVFVAPSLKLDVCHLPVKDLAFTNRIYMSGQDIAQLCPDSGDASACIHAEVDTGDRTGIWEVKPHPALEPGKIALNLLQRNYLEKGTGSSVHVQQIQALSDAELSRCRVHVADLTEQHAPGELSHASLMQAFRRLEGQVAAVDQICALDVEGQPYTGRVLRVTVLEVERSNQDAGFVRHGVLTRDTEIEFVPADGLHVRREE